MKKYNRDKKLYVWLIISLIIGLFLGIMIGELSTVGKSVAIYNTEEKIIESNNTTITNYSCNCINCNDSIYGSFVYGQHCKYSGKSTTVENIIYSCESCCKEFNCDLDYKLN